jgi:hypothetical protein
VAVWVHASELSAVIVVGPWLSVMVWMAGASIGTGGASIVPGGASMSPGGASMRAASTLSSVPPSTVALAQPAMETRARSETRRSIPLSCLACHPPATAE